VTLFYKSPISTNGNLSFLKNKIGVCETEVDESRIFIEKVLGVEIIN
jgi:hypothetical protein